MTSPLFTLPALRRARDLIDLRPYGIEALFRDDSGNWFSLTQSKYAAAQPS